MKMSLSVIFGYVLLNVFVTILSLWVFFLKADEEFTCDSPITISDFVIPAARFVCKVTKYDNRHPIKKEK